MFSLQSMYYTDAVILLASAALFTITAEGRPQSAVYVRFVSPPHGYTHGLEVHYPGAAPVAKEERLYLPVGQQHNQQRQYQQPSISSVQQDVQYHYPRPNRVFHELGNQFVGSYPLQNGRPESLFPVGLFQGPSSAAAFQREHPGPSFDPFLITGSLADRIVGMILGHGILYFHEVPHERLVIQTNAERIENNLIPHRLGSIRPGHPFFNYNK